MKQLTIFEAATLTDEGRAWAKGDRFDHNGIAWTVHTVGRRYMIVTDSSGRVDAWIVAEGRLVSDRDGAPPRLELRD